MREIKLITLGKEGERGYINYRDMIELMAETPADPRIGMKPKEMRVSMRIIDALEGAEDVLLLEDNDHAMLVDKVNSFGFRYGHKNILKFIDDIESAEAIKKDGKGDK